MSKFQEIDISKIKTISIIDRASKVNINKFAKSYKKGMSFQNFFDSLPIILKGEELRELINHIIKGYLNGKPLIWMMGAHVIKCGLSPIVIDLLKRGIISAIALNGAGAIHDVETAFWGQTSEDVEKNLQDGTFGMSEDTAKILNETVLLKESKDLGFGEVLGKKISEDKPEFCNNSILANAYELDIPVTVHVAIGTDIVHQHQNANGAAIGERSLRDFRILAHVVSKISNGGVVLNIGSSVILPEVFLKALTVARNLDNSIDHFYTANFDMIQHYRPQVNVIRRPTISGGKGYNFTGHHELMIPLLAAAIIEKI